MGKNPWKAFFDKVSETSAELDVAKQRIAALEAENKRLLAKLAELRDWCKKEIFAYVDEKTAAITLYLDNIDELRALLEKGGGE